MCVIIYVPKESEISKEEVLDAWSVNPHGAGYSIQTDDKVYFERGFMNVESYWNAIKEYIGKKNLLLHFRISTSKEINKMQTHPYKKGNVTITKGYTTKPVIAMNGIISNQKEYKDCNDTMSYIIDHQEAFANINQDILDIIEYATDAKWAVMMPNEVLLSSKFQEENGRWYSNKNHLYSYYYYNFNRKSTSKYKTFRKIIQNKKLRNAIRRDKILYEDLLDFIDSWCNGEDNCEFCTKCLKTANTLRDVKLVLKENYWIDESICTLFNSEYDDDLQTEYNNEEYNEGDYDCYLDWINNSQIDY